VRRGIFQLVCGPTREQVISELTELMNKMLAPHKEWYQKEVDSHFEKIPQDLQAHKNTYLREKYDIHDNSPIVDFLSALNSLEKTNQDQLQIDIADIQHKTHQANLAKFEQLLQRTTDSTTTRCAYI
jgi:hypothetical protein